jgi:flagellar protein FliO/FliZ
MLSGLLFLLVLVLGAAWLIKRAGGMPALRGNASMKIVAAMSLGPRERVVLIEVGGQQWLLGVSAGSVNALHHFEQPLVVGGSDDFAGKLRQLWPQGVGSPGSQGLNK